MKRRSDSAARQRPLTNLFIFLFPLAIAALVGAAVLWPSATAAQEPAVPPATPDASTGLEIFAERCSNCHGPMGLGDGEMASQLPQPPAAIGSQEYLRQAVPAEMFDVVTNGVLESGMPPFGPANSSDPLDETSRWNAIAAVYSLGTPPDALETGEGVYQAACSDCHGPDGVAEAFDLTAQSYWASRSNQQVFDTLAAGGDAVSEHEEIDLSEEEVWAVVDYARTFSYDYASPMEAFAPIEAATITGTVVNETTGEPLGAGVPVELNTFTADFEPSTTMTATLDEEGTFNFNLTMVPADQVYVATVEYNDISFGSDFGEIDRESPVLELPITVYEQTSDPAAVRVGQLHVILEFTEEEVQVSELYQFSHDAPTVFIGESGDPAQGTVQLTLPDGASTPSFSRTFGSMDSFFPAENVIPTDNGWADTVPLRPGQSTLSLLVRYTLPYESGSEIAHPVHYDVDHVNLVLTTPGVTLADAEESQWTSQGQQAMGGGSFLSYIRDDVPAGESVAFSLEGEPRPQSGGQGGGSAAVAPDESTEILIGGGVLLLAAAVGVYLARLWRRQSLPEPVGAEEVAEPTAPIEERAARKEELLQAIAQLDDAYEAGEIDEDAYEERRQALKEALLAIWNGGD